MVVAHHLVVFELFRHVHTIVEIFKFYSGLFVLVHFESHNVNFYDTGST